MITGRPFGLVAQYAKGPGFESRSGHVLFFLPCDTYTQSIGWVISHAQLHVQADKRVKKHKFP